MIYLDNSATAPIDEEVRDAMLPYLNEEFGNPSSKYYCKATHAKNAVEEAREKVAKLLGANPDEIIFTAGATESTNFIIKGYLDYRKFYGDGKNHVITSLVEHKATLNTCKYLNGELYSNNDPRKYEHVPTDKVLKLIDAVSRESTSDIRKDVKKCLKGLRKASSSFDTRC